MTRLSISLVSTSLILGIANTARAHDGEDHVAADSRAALLAEDYEPFEIYPGATAGTYAGGPGNQYGEWGPLINWPHVPVSASNLPDGRILTWASNEVDGFPDGPEYTHATVWNPFNNTFQNIPHGNHDMFCSHAVMLEDGRVFINGGRHTPFTTLFDPRTNAWSRLQNMANGRWYPTTVAMPDGRVFTGLGGSGGMYPEIWDKDLGWNRLTGINFTASTDVFTDKGANPANPHYEHNWWPYFALTSSGNILHYGPTPKMQMLDVDGNGSAQALGNFTSQWYPKHGASIMYHQGKILLAGGAASGTNQTSTNKTMLLDVSTSTPTLDTSIPNMTYTRKFHNAVVLPNGEVLMIGGNKSGIKFDDQDSRLEGEIWNPSTKQFRPMASMNRPRNYHSVALLLTDGRVLAGGGGLRGPNSPFNHPNIQVYSPPYLYESDGSLAVRPSIYSAPDAVNHGSTVTVQATPGVAYFSLIRMSATTHAMNTDVRRIRANSTETSPGWYDVPIHPNANVLVPGYYMMFAVSGSGTPSISHVLQVNAGASVSNYDPILTVPDNPALRRGVQEYVNSSATDIDSNQANFMFTATGLPPGMTINASTGTVSGQPTLNGNYQVSITVNDGDGGSDTETRLWLVADPGDVDANPNKGFNYQYFEGSWTQLPNFGNLTPKREGKSTDFDINELSDVYDYFGFRFHGYILITKQGNYTFHVSSNDGSRLWIDNNLIVDNDGVHGTQEVSGTVNLGVGYHSFRLDYFDEKNAHVLDVAWNGPGFNRTSIPPAVQYRQVPVNNATPVLSSPGNLTSDEDSNVDVQMSATDADGEPLTYSATGLPIGLSISNSGRITGSPTDIGNYTVTVTARDPQNASDSVSFSWMIEQVIAPPLAVAEIVAAPARMGTTVNYTLDVSGGRNPKASWDFGDGSTPTNPSANMNRSHVFAAPGRYVVIVNVTSNDGTNKQIQFIQSIHRSLTANAPKSSSSILYEVVAGSANRIWNVNPDNDSVTVYNAHNSDKIAEIAVGNNPRSLDIASNGQVWVTNRLSASISIIDPDSMSVVDEVELDHGAQPHGIVFSQSGNIAWVVLAGPGSLAKIHFANGSVLETTEIGGSLRDVSIEHDDSNLLLPRYITPALPNESGKTPVTIVNGNPRGGQVLVFNTSTSEVIKTIRLRHSTRSDAENSSRGIPNYLAAAAISPDGVSAWVPSKQDNILRGQYRDGQPLTHDSTVRAISSQIDLNTGEELHSARMDHDDGGTPTAAAFGPNGVYLYVALEGSRQVVMVDSHTYTEIARFNVGRAPQGIAVSPNGDVLYVHNFMDRSVSRINISTVLETNNPGPLNATQVNTVTNEKLSSNVLKGKQFFYDAQDDRLASQDYISCASCHSDGGHDGRTWDRADVGEGLRNTIDLRGRAGVAHGPLHWSGNFDEVHDFEAQIRDLAGGAGLMTNAQFNAGSRHHPLGDGKTGVNADLDALAVYIQSLTDYPPSPHRRTDGKLTGKAQDGRVMFMLKGCGSCHAGDHMTDSAMNNRHDIGTIRGGSGERLGEALGGIDTPTLRGSWATAPYLHDGSAATIEEAILAHDNVTVTNSQLDKIAEYIRQLENPGSEGAEPDLGNSTGPGEVGRLYLTQANADAWRTVNLSRAYADPVVVATPVSSNQVAPVTIRIRNVRPSSFELKMSTWDYQNGVHKREEVAYMVVEAGVHRLVGGERLVAGSESAVTQAWKTISYEHAFAKKPVVFSSIVSDNDMSAVVPRLRRVRSRTFRVRLQTEEANTNYHSPETVNWIAIQSGSRNKVREVGVIKGVSHKWRSMKFSQQYSRKPVVLAQSQLAMDTDVAVLRHHKLNRRGLLLRMQEERSADQEFKHAGEWVGFAVFPGTGRIR